MNSPVEEALFALVLERPAEKRAAFLEVVCEGNAPLRARLEALLAAHEQSDGVLALADQPARPTVKLGLPDQTKDEAVGQTIDRIALWRIPEGTALTNYPVAIPRNMSWLTGMAVAPDLSVVAYYVFGTIRLLDLAAGEVRWKTNAANKGFLRAVAISPDGKLLASGADFIESAILLWDVSSGQEVGRLEGHRLGVAQLKFWPDGKTLASAGQDHTIGLWDLTHLTNRAPVRLLRRHSYAVSSLALLPDNHTLVSGSADGSVCVWDTATPPRDDPPIQVPAGVAAWRFTPDSQAVLTLDFQGNVARWRALDFQEGAPILNVGTNGVVVAGPYVAAEISCDGRWLAIGRTNRVIEVWDILHRNLRWTFEVESAWPVGFDPDGKTLIAEPGNEYDLTTGRRTRSRQFLEAEAGFGLCPDGRWMVAVGRHGHSVRWDRETGQETSFNLNIDIPWYIGISGDGRLLAGISVWGYTRLWETATWRQVRTLSGFLSAPYSLAFSPDSARLAAGSGGPQAVRLWDVASGEELLTLESEIGYYIISAFSPDGNVIGAKSPEGVLHLWRAPSWAEIEAVEAAEKARPNEP